MDKRKTNAIKKQRKFLKVDQFTFIPQPAHLWTLQDERLQSRCTILEYTLLTLKLVVKLGQHLCMMILSNLLCYFLQDRKYFGIESCINLLFNLVRYFFPLSRIFWDDILHDGSFRFVPLLFTSYKIFNDIFYIIWYIINNIVHDGC